MKLLSTTEVKDKKQAELARDIGKIENVRNVLDKATSDLNVVNSSFELALARNQKKWAEEEKMALARIQELKKEMKILDGKIMAALVPIEERERKAYALFTEAENILERAREKEHKAEQLKQSLEETEELMQDKLDTISDRENELDDREKRLFVREKANEDERTMIKDLSAELSIKLKDLFQ